eukprot:157566-Pyramimonas_sp.AAC.1
MALYTAWSLSLFVPQFSSSASVLRSSILGWTPATPSSVKSPEPSTKEGHLSRNRWSPNINVLWNNRLPTVSCAPHVGLRALPI